MSSAAATVAYARWVVRWRWFVVVACLAGAALAAWGATQLTVSTSYRVFFGADNPQLVTQDAIEATYTKVDNVTFVLKGADGDVFTPERLGVIKAITDQAWRMPYVIRVDSITNYQHTRAEGDNLYVRDLVDGVANLTGETIADIRAVALSEPTTRGRLVSADGATALINATVQFPDGAENKQPEVAAAARAIAADMEAQHPDLTVAVSGVVMLSNAYLEATDHDARVLLPLMLVFLTVMMVAFLRSGWGAVGPIVVVVLSVATAMGVAGWMGFTLTTASGAGPIIIMTIAIADSVHLLVSGYAELRKGTDRRQAVVESVRVNMQPVFLTSATTAIGFLSLNFSDAPPFRDLGNICAMGAGFAWLYSMLLLPALMAILPLKAGPNRRLEDRAVASIMEFAIAQRRNILIGTVALAVVFAAFLPRLTINDRFVELFAKGTEFRDDADFITANLPGVYLIEFSVGAGEEGGIAEPGYLERLDRFAGWLADQPEVAHVAVFTDIMKRLNKNLHGDDPAFYRLPGDRELAAQYLLLYEFSLPFGLDLNNQIDVGRSATRVTVSLHNVSSSQMKDVTQRAEAWLRANTPPPMHTLGSGVSLIFAYLTERNVRSMIGGTAVALVLISGCLMLALRSVRMGVISLMPNLTPPIFAFGIWAVVVGQIGLYSAAVTAAALGLIVDFTVHFLSKYQRARNERGLGAEDGVRYAFRTVGAALWISAFVLIAGFGALMLSDFVTNANLGLMTALIIFIALVTDFLVLPAILLVLDTAPSAGAGPIEEETASDAPYAA